MNKEQSHSQDTETRILEAAEKEFFEKGYAGARTTSIAEAAGVTHAMLSSSGLYPRKSICWGTSS